MAVLVHHLVTGAPSMMAAVSQALKQVGQHFKDSHAIEGFTNLIRLAQALSQNSIDDHQNLVQLGLGWVAEETVAIAVYCVLRYDTTNIAHVLAVAVNHDGDSDSTGALVGQLLGTRYGIDALPLHFIQQLDAYESIDKMTRYLAN